VKDNKVVIFSEQYENEKSGEKVEGITILIDGGLKQMLDVIIQREKQYENYAEVIRDLLFSGIEGFISKYR